MPIYQFYCDKCDSVFDELIHLNGKKPPTRRKCSECSKFAKRFYNVEMSVRVGGVTEKTKRVGREFAENGFNKQQAHEFYETHINASKKRVQTGFQHYKVYEPDFKVLEQQGTARRTNKREEKIKAAENLHKELAKRGPRNPHPQ